RQDDFPEFFNQRFEGLRRQIAEAMGKPVNRTADRSESPFRNPTHEQEVVEVGIRSLMTAGESRVVEFKSTGRKNLHTNDKDSAVEWGVVKSIAAFMNSHGGTLLVGVNDAGEAIGIETDYPFVKSSDRDGWELWLTDLVAQTLGKVAATEIQVRFGTIDGVTVARIDVSPGARPVFAVPLKGEKRDVFLARINNSTQELAGQALLDYQKKRWPA
ncbi:MAG: ATP-binding protein, partial [Dehalococcoidia bacterium]|nr:ATP-binding protein [Dehalococcoidia bacterium]